MITAQVKPHYYKEHGRWKARWLIGRYDNPVEYVIARKRVFYHLWKLNDAGRS